MNPDSRTTHSPQEAALPGKTLKLPKTVDLGDITVRDGLQTLEHYFTTAQKVRLAEEIILTGYKHVEVTNFGNPKIMPQFKDAEDVLEGIFNSERVGRLLKQRGGDVTVTTVTIGERSVDRAIAFKEKRGYGPDCLLQMVSTDEAHHRVNSGMSLDDYFKMSERCTQKAHAAGMQMCGTVSTIWGSPMKGSRITDMRRGVEFSKRYLELGVDYIEQADHDGSGDPARVYEYFTMILDPELMGKWADPKYHLCHCHTSRGMGLANYLAALMAGITRFETTLGGTGGQPANVVDGVFTGGTGRYYHFEHLYSGLVTTEDFVVMCASMGIETGIDLRKLLAVGRMFKDEYLAITPEQRELVLANVAKTTGIPRQKLESLETASDAALDALVEEATRRTDSAEGGVHEHVHENMHGILSGLRNYLRWKAWAPARSESILSDLPPSPHLRELLGE
jgi:hydroxymethylglutaryl-CoA lyase